MVTFCLREVVIECLTDGGASMSRITGYSSHLAQTEFGVWYDVTCEICFHYEERADHDVLVPVFMGDRRRSFAVVKTW